MRDDEVFEQALTLFHQRSLQNDEAVRAMLELGLLPPTRRDGFAALDIGAGQGHLPALLQPHVDTLHLVEPNERCVERLRQSFGEVVPLPWAEAAAAALRAIRPEGFDLITMSHMIYHFASLDEIRSRLELALGLLRGEGHLVVVINQPSAPTARLGIEFMKVEGRLAEAATNLGLHAACHEPGFYRSLAGGHVEVAIHPVDSPLAGVRSREELLALLRMALLNPLSRAACDLARLDAFTAAFLDAEYPGLAYPATLPSQDEMVVVGLLAAR